MEEIILDYKWFIIHTHSGFEAKVIESIKEEVKKRKLESLFQDYLVPTQKIFDWIGSAC